MYTDKDVKFEYNPENNKFAFKKNHVGATAGDELEVADFTYTDDNSIFLSNTSGNDGNDGTQASPKKTMLAAINACTSYRIYVIVLDGYIYAEDLSAYNNDYFAGAYACLEADREWGLEFSVSKRIEPNVVPSVPNIGMCTCNVGDNWMVTYSDSGDGGNGKYIIFDDNYDIVQAKANFHTGGTSYISASTFLGGQAIIAFNDTADVVGKFVIIDTDGSILVSETTFNADDTSSIDTCILPNGNMVIAFVNAAGSGLFKIIDSTGGTVVDSATFKVGNTQYTKCAALSTGDFVIAFVDSSGVPNTGDFVIYSSLGVLVKAETTFESGEPDLTNGCIAVFSNDDFGIYYADTGDTDDGKFVVYDDDGDVVVSPTVFDSGDTGYIVAHAWDDDTVSIVYEDTGVMYCLVQEKDGTVVQDKFQVEDNSSTSMGKITSRSDSRFIASFSYTSGISEGRYICLTRESLPRISHRTLSFTPGDADTIFVSAEQGEDTISPGSQHYPVATLQQAASLCDGAHQRVVIMDSETYYITSPPLTFSGNFLGLYAAIGETPEIRPYEFDDIGVEMAVADIGAAAAGDVVSCCRLLNGNWIVAYLVDPGGGTLDGKFTVRDEDGVEITSGTFFTHNANQYAINCKVIPLVNGNFVIVYQYYNIPSGYSFMYCTIYNSSGSSLASSSIATTDEGVSTFEMSFGACALPNGNFCIAYCNYNYGVNALKLGYRIFDINCTSIANGNINHTFDNTKKIHILVSATEYDNYWMIATHTTPSTYTGITFHRFNNLSYTGATSMEAGDEIYLNDMIGLGSNTYDVALIYRNITEGGCKLFMTYSGSYAYLANDSYAATVARLNTGDIIITYGDKTDDKLYYIIYSTDGDVIILATLVEADYGKYIDSCVLYNNNRQCIVYNRNSDDLVVGTINSFGISELYVIADASEISGCKLNFMPQKCLLGIKLDDNGELTIAWSDLYNHLSPIDNTYVINTKAAAANFGLTMTNSSIYDCNGGVNLIDGYLSTDILDNQFFRISDEYAIYLDCNSTAGADTTIEHNTITQSYGGIRLENNDGNETVINMILHDNDVYDIEADTNITLDNSVITGQHSGVTIGSMVVTGNPRFINEGAIDPDDIDLNIKLRSLGYSVDSSAYDLADDDRNAGAWDVAVIGTAATWTSVTVEKPNEIKRWVDPVGEIFTRKKDGSVETSYEGITEFLEFPFTGLTVANYAQVEAMIWCGNNQVRIYYDPTTYPDNYVLFKIVYQKMSKSAKSYTLNATGYSDIVLQFARKYEV